MINKSRDVDLIDDLISSNAELPWLEFKRNFNQAKMIGVRCSALSNAARIEGQDFGYMIWGVDDQFHNVIGTKFNPDSQKEGNQGLCIWLAQRLQPDVPFQFRVVDHPEGRVVLLEIPAATNAPVSFESIAYIRIGSATPKLVDHPERHRALIEALRPYSWEHGIARQYVTGDEVLEWLDYAQYFRLTAQPLPDNREGIFEHLEADQLITRDPGQRWNITNLGAILFASRFSFFNQSLARKGVRFIAYSGNNRASAVRNRLDGQRGYASGFEGLVGYINSLIPKNEHIGAALRTAMPLFPELAIRELVANSVIHQDMTITGAGPQIELFEDRIEITNPGRPLVQPHRMIDLPPRSRNESLASLMRRMGLCEEQGSGLDKVIAQAEVFQLPPPLFREEADSMRVVLYGPRNFAQMTPDERVRACYQHAVLKYLSGERMKNATLLKRFGIDPKNASQASLVIKNALENDFIKPADPDHPRAGYVPNWA